MDEAHGARREVNTGRARRRPVGPDGRRAARLAARRPGWSASLLVRTARLLVVRENLFPPGTRALVLVSGGQDSVALLELLAAGLLGKPGPAELRVLHINHHLRGAESDADEALVVGHCRRLGVTLEVVHRPLEKDEGNVQERAREERRAVALEAAARLECERIALGHTADDQAENLLYRMGRYGGLAALRGMLPCDPPWVRPLLGVRREDTARFCSGRGLTYAVDTGNLYPGYARTGIREKVLPVWEAVLPGSVGAAARVAEVAAELELLLEKSIQASGLDPSRLELEVPRLSALPLGLRRLVLHAWLEEHGPGGVSRASVLAVEELLGVRGSACRDLEGGRRVWREYDRIWLSSGCVSGAPGMSAGVSPPPGLGGGLAASPGMGAGVSPPALVPPHPVELTVPGRAEWGRLVLEAEPVEHFFAPDPACEAYVDARSLVEPLRVRAPLAGDRVRPLGASGSRKLQDILVDLRVPTARRPRVPLVVAGEEILWVGGLLVSESGRITAETDRIVRLRLLPAVAEGTRGK